MKDLPNPKEKWFATPFGAEVFVPGTVESRNFPARL